MAGLKLNGTVFKKGMLEDIIKRKCTEKAVAKLDQSAYEATEILSEMIERQEKGIGFHTITGNLASSISVSVVKLDPKKGKYVLHNSFRPADIIGLKATRRSLRKNEVYTLPFNALGDKSSGYKGETDPGGMYGAELAKDVRQAIRHSSYAGKRNMASIYVSAAMPYAKYIDMKHMHHLSDSIKYALKESL